MFRPDPLARADPLARGIGSTHALGGLDLTFDLQKPRFLGGHGQNACHHELRIDQSRDCCVE